MKILIKIYKDLKEQKRIKARKELDKNLNHGQGYLEQIDKLGKIIDKNIAQYNKYKISHSDEAVVAYVMLRSMEGKARLLSAYKDNVVKRWCLTNCCCSGKRYKTKMFLGDWLEVDNAVAPDIINWENLGSSTGGRCFRISLTTIFSAILIVGSFVLLLIAQYYQSQLASYSP
jgi:hypothetical protein